MSTEPSKTKVRDPVCGMMIKPEKAVDSVTLRGVTYYFCTHVCKREFDSDPDQYLRDG